jgi:tetratricopeptide (TPR) repeat protein
MPEGEVVDRRRFSRTTVIAFALALSSALCVLIGIGSVRPRDARPAESSAPIYARLPARPEVAAFPAVSFARSMPAHLGAVKSVVFVPNRERLLSSSSDGTAKVWDLKTDRPVRVLHGHTSAVRAIRIGADGRRAATAGDRTVRVYSLLDGKLERTIDADDGQVFAAAVSPGGQTIVSGGTGGQAKVWGVDGTLRATLDHGGARVLAIAFSPDGSSLVTAGEDGIIKVWDVADWQLRHTLAGHQGAVNDVAVAADGQMLASAGDDRTVRLWHLDYGTALAVLSLHNDSVWSVAFSPDGTMLLSGGRDALLGVWAPATRALRQTIRLEASLNGTPAVAFAPDGTAFASAHGDGEIDLWSVARSGAHLPLPTPSVARAATSPSATPEERTYAEAQERALAYEGEGTGLDEAESAYRGLLEANPRSALGYAGLAAAALERARFSSGADAVQQIDRALDLASKAIALAPALADAYGVRAWTLRAKGDAPGARLAADAARRLAPSMPSGVVVSAELAMDDGNLVAAEELLREAIGHPMAARFASAELATLADVYGRMGDVDADGEARRWAIRLSPESAQAKSDYADFLIRKGDYDGAIAALTPVLEGAGDRAAARVLANAYCRKAEKLLWEKGDGESALKAFEQAARVDAKSACSAYGIGAYHQYVAAARAPSDTLRIREARRWFSKAKMLDPDSELAKSALAALGD